MALWLCIVFRVSKWGGHGYFEKPKTGGVSYHSLKIDVFVIFGSITTCMPVLTLGSNAILHGPESLSCCDHNISLVGPC